MEKPLNLPHFFFMPTMGCVAKCRYCYSPLSAHKMDDHTLKQTISWIKASVDSFVRENHDNFIGRSVPYLRFTYHGGEPLLMGKEFIKNSLELLDDMDIPFQKHISLQSNLWLLDEDLCRLFKDYQVNVGTSLDGPEKITDNQRGKGYFRKTMKSIELLRKHDIPVSCICTFTKANAPYYDEIFNFFLKENLNFKFFMVQPTMDKEFESDLSLTCQEQSELVESMLQLYLLNPGKIRIHTLDIHCLSLTGRFSGGFVQGNCIGRQFAIGPDGGIYNCQMFVGHEKYKWGSVSDTHSLSDIFRMPSWMEFQEWQANQKHNCRDCSYVDICTGGCIFNAIMANGGLLDTNRKDSNCQAYRDSMDAINTIQQQAMSLSEQDAQGSIKYSEQQLLSIKSFRALLKAFWKNRSS